MALLLIPKSIFMGYQEVFHRLFQRSKEVFNCLTNCSLEKSESGMRGSRGGDRKGGDSNPDKVEFRREARKVGGRDRREGGRARRVGGGTPAHNTPKTEEQQKDTETPQNTHKRHTHKKDTHPKETHTQKRHTQGPHTLHETHNSHEMI